MFATSRLRCVFALAQDQSRRDCLRDRRRIASVRDIDNVGGLSVFSHKRVTTDVTVRHDNERNLSAGGREPELTVRPDKLMYVSEMAAAAAAVGVFISVYIVGYLQTGALVTLLFAWMPAAILAWLTARLLRAAVQVVVDMTPSCGVAGFGPQADELAPIAVRVPRRRDHDGRDG
ncbi:MAG: hypothetical protein MUC86_01365 [Burkholderiaceae bacterium]|jgi:hypothetical protein|nr:hypothetical protein [Burkholderiaceae bacterium]